MNSDPLYNLLQENRKMLDAAEPENEHTNRFLGKLQRFNKTKTSKTLWRSVIAVAASVIIVLGLVLNLNKEAKSGLSSVSPEMAETQQFFTRVIHTELDKLKNESNPLFNDLIKGTLNQLTILESDYNIMVNDLSKNHNNQRVIIAMVNNLQKRIDLLQDVLWQIEIIKNENNFRDESQTI